MWELLVNGALPVTSQWGKLFVCVCDLHGGLDGVVLYQSVSRMKKLIFFLFSRGLQTLLPGSYLTTEELLALSGVCWACNNTTEFDESNKKTKASAIPWLKHESELSSEHNLTFILLSKHSVETPQHSGNKIQTHTSRGKYSCFTFWESWVIKNQV